MLDKTPEDLASFRLDQAKECLQAADVALATNSFKTAANRSYYCIFHSMRAVQALDRFDSQKHSGIISEFRRNYIKTGIFSIEYSNIIGHAFKVRNNSDYIDFYIISKDEVAVQIENARVFLEAVETYIASKLGQRHDGK